MNINSITFIILVVSLYVGISLLMLRVGGLLIRNDLDPALAAKQGNARSASRILEDLRGIQETVVAFIGKSVAARKMLERLVERKDPTSVRKVLGSGDSASEKALTAFFFAWMAGLIRLTRRA